MRDAEWIAYGCPCDRGHRVILNLSSQRWPRWSVTRLRRPSLEPGVDDQTVGRRRYRLSDGEVHWEELISAHPVSP